VVKREPPVLGRLSGNSIAGDAALPFRFDTTFMALSSTSVILRRVFQGWSGFSFARTLRACSLLLPQAVTLSMTNFPLLRIPREAKFYDIAPLFLWLTGGIARKGNAKKEKDHDHEKRKSRRKNLGGLHRLNRREA
jgi:hypothetical protein